ncbi:preprotein translocase subunit SecE [Candidatus Nitrosoglobus terrae]|uniref:Protein translocase subunit SecE n=1 Tax=Candidatus Nitrosoglobus terrae TaxID=1630141 RepID=A0A1Q2SLJ5_9GAMM|nr:preprotein translocase subunit SecE [Candidatus Nitrosoglobus terrae]BAW80016.1 preprotein translocase subunit SecE [Candidatus Nitrosoglobus terrae]
MADIIKFTVALLLLGTATGLFYYFGDHSTPLRVFGLLIALGISLAILAKTVRGQAILNFTSETQAEFRKIAWPAQQETTRTTLIVLLMVVAVASILWLFDMLLMWVVRLLTGQGV